MAEFDKIAKSYEEWHSKLIKTSGFGVDFFYEYKIKEIKRILQKHKIKPPLSILDFGCGIGNVDPYIRKHFPDAKIYGVDMSEESINVARAKQADYDITYEVLAPDWRTLPQQFETKFDLIFISNVFHHAVVEEHDAIINYCGVHMNPASLLFAFELNPYNPAARMVFNRHDKPVDKNANLVYPRYLKNKIKDSNFRILQRNYTVFFPKALRLFMPLEKYIKFVPMGAHYYIMAEKI